MAVLDVEFFSRALMRNVSFKAVLPNDKQHMHGNDKLKTLYLLNGIFGSGKDWLMQTTLQEMAERKKLAVILPNGENRFYVDHVQSGSLYSTYIAEELVAFTRSIFPLSCAQEDTYIAGLSMGGYGALVNGLNHPETFSMIGAFSPALIIEDAVRSVEDSSLPLINRRSYYASLFGDLDQLKGSIWDYDRLIEDETSQFVFLACGKQDFLYPQVSRFAQKLDGAPIRSEIVFEDGDHNWDFWRPCLEKFIDLLPLDPNACYIGSGQACSMEDILY